MGVTVGVGVELTVDVIDGVPVGVGVGAPQHSSLFSQQSSRFTR